MDQVLMEMTAAFPESRCRAEFLRQASGKTVSNGAGVIWNRDPLEPPVIPAKGPVTQNGAKA
jgi:hypothetical protein